MSSRNDDKKNHTAKSYDINYGFYHALIFHL